MMPKKVEVPGSAPPPDITEHKRAREEQDEE